MAKYLQGISPPSRPGQPSTDPKIRQRLENEYQERRKRGDVPDYDEQMKGADPFEDFGPPPMPKERRLKAFSDVSKQASGLAWRMHGDKSTAGAYARLKQREMEERGVPPAPKPPKRGR